MSGALGAAWLLAARLRQAAVVLAFPVAYYVVAGSGYTVFARYMIPLLPFLCLTAAWLVVTVVRASVPASAPAVRRVAIGVAAVLVVAPSALKVVQIDRLLARTDNRVIVSEALAALIPPGSTVYHTGAPYGHVYWAPGLALHEWHYDEASGTFGDGARVPQWIILQRSPLMHYSYVSPTIERLVRDRYELVRSFPVTADGSDRLYDQQDAFFLPLDGLAGIERPGPSYEIYRLLKDPAPGLAAADRAGRSRTLAADRASGGRRVRDVRRADVGDHPAFLGAGGPDSRLGNRARVHSPTSRSSGRPRTCTATRSARRSIGSCGRSASCSVPGSRTCRMPAASARRRCNRRSTRSC